MSEITPFPPHCLYLALFILLSLGSLGLPVREVATLFLSGILVTVSITKVLATLQIFYPGLLMTDLLQSIESRMGGADEIRLLCESRAKRWSEKQAS